MQMIAPGLFVASAVLTMAVANPAHAQAPPEQTNVVNLVGKAKAEPREARARRAKPEDRFLFAVVRFDGSLARGHGVKQTLRTSTGSYRVFFNRDVTECSFVVSVSGTGTDDVHGVADAAHVMGKPKGLYVNTFDIQVETGGNTLARKDAPFHLQVMCAPE